jgi:c-di-GMP-binding flagellar brake protein YcgR
VQNFVDRRAYPRQHLLVSVRRPGESSADRWLTTRDVSAGGMRLLSATALVKGDRMPLEVLLPDGSWLAVTTKVAWSVKLDVGSTAEYEVGLRFLELGAEELERLQPLLPVEHSTHVDGGVRDN